MNKPVIVNARDVMSLCDHVRWDCPHCGAETTSQFMPELGSISKFACSNCKKLILLERVVTVSYELFKREAA